MKIQHILKITDKPSQGLFITVQVKKIFLSSLRFYYMEDIVPDLKSAIEITTALDRTESRREDKNKYFLLNVKVQDPNLEDLISDSKKRDRRILPAGY